MASPIRSSAYVFLTVAIALLSVLTTNDLRADEPETAQPMIAYVRAALVRLGARLEFDRNTNVDVVKLEAFKDTDRAMRLVSQLSHVRTLYLDDSDITDEGLVEVGKLKNLESLGLSGTSVTNAGLQHLVQLAKLTELGLSGTNVGSAVRGNQKDSTKPGVLSPTSAPVGKGGVLAFEQMRALKFLTLDGSGFVDADMGSLEALVNLEDLMLPRSISDVGLAHLKPLRNLRSLFLADTRVTDKGLEHLAGHDKLEYLTLYGTKVTDAGVRQLAELKGLKEVVLARTRTTHAGIAMLRKARPGISIQWPD